jgi:hypothetical protein
MATSTQLYYSVSYRAKVLRKFVWHRQLYFRWLLEFFHLAEGDFPSLMISIASDILDSGFMNEYANAMLPTKLLQFRKIWRYFLLVFEADKNVRVN